ncbi:MAG TPA: extracellular solute-binding protein [Acidimicrobiales bacterium]|jgi:molybdate/tungstate transport system substrate-binding protein|nr:extracellular solute-binding protein [Acidimicrobiales bacterium]
MRKKMAYVMAAGLAAATAACSSNSSTSVPPTTASIQPSSDTSNSSSTTAASGQGSGPVDVLYAGSLVKVMTDGIGPAFHSATGYTFTGTSGDSGTLANEIKGKTTVADVFISASPAKDQLLEGAANGNQVTWYATFATSPLVLGYNPNSKFAQGLRTEPWYQSINQSGLLLGRTDPATDPKGKLTETALTTAATTFNEPALKSDASNSSEVFPETTLVGRMQSGQLDAGFFYQVEATVAHIPFVPVTGVGTQQAVYTITVVENAPHRAAANAFVTYLLGSAGQQLLTSDGLVLTKPATVSGTAPASLQTVLSGM